MLKRSLGGGRVNPLGQAGSSLLRYTVFLAVIAALGYVVVGSFNSKKAPKLVAVTATPAPAAQPATETPIDPGLRNLEAQLLAAAAPGNEIERVRNATVLIKTEWASGSGFFVSRDCRIVTNKHVVMISDRDIADADNELNRLQRVVDEVKAAVAERRKYFYEHCAPNCDQEAYDRYMQDWPAKVVAAEEELSRARSRLAGVNHSRLQVFLYDGTELDASLERVSDKHDLAMLKLDGAFCPVIRAGDENTLRQGDTLFTVGNPIGLKFTVTSGVFSGFLQEDELRLLQTDAPINPGNSGGPLFDRMGRVVGVNTWVARRAQGIGFAIPISAAVAEFGLRQQ